MGETNYAGFFSELVGLFERYGVLELSDEVEVWFPDGSLHLLPGPDELDAQWVIQGSNDG